MYNGVEKMPKTYGQKQRILYMLKYFYEKTDEKHTVTVNNLISYLNCYDITANRKTIYDDIEVLQDFGFDIVKNKSKTHNFYLASRNFELSEIKILIDAVQASKFITLKKSQQLISELCSLLSSYESKQINRQVYVLDRVKNMNESILYNVDNIHNAIAENKRLRFRYFEYDYQCRKIYHKDKNVNPLALIYSNENYYMITYNEKYDNNVTYRVDRMESVEIDDEPRILPPEEFDPAGYVKPIFGMYHGDIETVTVLFENDLAKTVIDRFGMDTPMRKYDEEHFIARFDVALSDRFLAWIIGFGNKCRIISPDYVKERAKNLALEVAKQYE